MPDTAYMSKASPELQYSDAPFPHLVIDPVLPPETFEKISFPQLAPLAGGRAGHDLYRGQDGWDAEIAKPGFAELASLVLSETFVQRVLNAFADDMRRENCLVDPDKVYFDGFVESFEDGAKKVLSETHDPNALFVRFDFQASGADYAKAIHCDYARRIVGGLFFMTDAESEGLQGGEFALFSDAAFANDRVCHEPVLEKVFPLRRNQGVLFLNSNRGFHGPRPIKAMSGMRKWIYYSISSRRNVW